jgi:hypothetical protein
MGVLDAVRGPQAIEKEGSRANTASLPQNYNQLSSGLD